METLITGLKAAGEPTRLRILALLSRTELTVSELCRVLGQTQPRVSRHLKLLCEAQLLDRHTQGTRAFYRPARSGSGREIFEAVLQLVDDKDPVLGRDLARLDSIRTERAAHAADYFERVAADWDRMRGLHVADAEVEAAMLEAVGGLDVRELLDVGTGTGRVLEIFADRIEHGIGLDRSRQMLDLARSRLDDLGLKNCSVRHGNVYDIALDDGSIDVAVLHHVLHFLDDPAGAINEVARTLRPDGRLLLVDFAPHHHETMRDDYAHHWLGFADDVVEAWCEHAGLVDVSVRHLVPADAGEAGLTVTIWSASQRQDAPAVYNLEAAS